MNMIDHVAMVDFQTLTFGDFKFTRIQPHLLQDRRINIGDTAAVLHSVEIDSVGRPMNGVLLEPPSAIHTLNPKM